MRVVPRFRTHKDRYSPEQELHPEEKKHDNRKGQPRILSLLLYGALFGRVEVIYGAIVLWGFRQRRSPTLLIGGAFVGWIVSFEQAKRRVRTYPYAPCER